MEKGGERSGEKSRFGGQESTQEDSNIGEKDPSGSGSQSPPPAGADPVLCSVPEDPSLRTKAKEAITQMKKKYGKGKGIGKGKGNRNPPPPPPPSTSSTSAMRPTISTTPATSTAVETAPSATNPTATTSSATPIPFLPGISALKPSRTPVHPPPGLEQKVISVPLTGPNTNPNAIPVVTFTHQPSGEVIVQKTLATKVANVFVPKGELPPQGQGTTSKLGGNIPNPEMGALGNQTAVTGQSSSTVALGPKGTIPSSATPEQFKAGLAAQNLTDWASVTEDNPPLPPKQVEQPWQTYQGKKGQKNKKSGQSNQQEAGKN